MPLNAADQQNIDPSVREQSTASKATDYAISTHELTFQYPGAEPLLLPVSFNIH